MAFTKSVNPYTIAFISLMFIGSGGMLKILFIYSILLFIGVVLEHPITTHIDKIGMSLLPEKHCHANKRSAWLYTTISYRNNFRTGQ